MAKVIIGIHGLGNKPPKPILEKWWKMAILEGLKANNFSTDLPTFELVYWADITHQDPLNELEKDPHSPFFVKERYETAPKDFQIENHNTQKKVLDFIGRQLTRIFLNEDFSLNHSYITDVIVKRFFKDLEIYYTENCPGEDDKLCKAKDLIKERLITVLKKYKGDDIMIVSHSMGTIIAFDVLGFEVPEIPVNTFITMGSPLGLPVVISKIAAEQMQTLHITDHMITPTAVTKNWINFSDVTDKVAFGYKLAEDFSENKNGVKPVDIVVVNNYELNGKKNPHKSFGYLRAPEFSSILNEFMIPEKLSIRQKVLRTTTQIINAVKAQISFQNQNDNTSS